METIIQQKVIEVANTVEKQLDAELERLDNLDINDIEKLRENRLQELKKLQKQKQDWLSLGHGEYTEIPDEKEFFEISKKSQNIVCLFYKDDSPRCKIVDHHFKILANKHLEAKFCKLNVERCPFLTERLRIKIIPTIALIVNGKTKDYIVGFTQLGNCDDFSTETLEVRIAQSGAISCNDDFIHSSNDTKKPWLSHIVKPKTIKGHESDDSDDD
ncbi:thioredoxin domain-containing protein 9 [Vespula squamosa]|uniref:Thioredoxin domain-containing protein 9 n=1 Tax=Vespula squamosa TaxID=30214 RepID=A0ABD2A3Z0_VESSQ